MGRILASIHYISQGYWKRLATMKNLVSATKLSKDVAWSWLNKQAISQIYLPGPWCIPRPKFNVAAPNEVHQTDVLFVPHDHIGKRTFKYALAVVDLASRFKAAEPLTTKGPKRLSMLWLAFRVRAPEVAQIAPGWPWAQVYGSTSQLPAKYGTEVHRKRVDVHHNQAIIDHFNWQLAERIFGHQYAQELANPSIR